MPLKSWIWRRKSSSKMEIIMEERGLFQQTGTSSETLPIDLFYDWFNAIIKDDIHYVSTRLESCTEAEKWHLLNGSFDYGDANANGLKLEDNHGQSLKIIRPLCLAAVFGAREVLKFFLKCGANVAVIDNNGYNVIHCMIAFSVFEPEKEMSNVGTYKILTKLLSIDVLQDLLFQENEQKLRPVEMAAQCGAFTLLETIFETEGIYVTRIDRKGLYNYRFIDITEYETYNKKNRRTKSPLFFLTLLHHKDLKRPGTQTIFKRPLMEKWMNGKFYCSRPGVFAWAFVRLVFVAVYFMQDSVNLHYLPSHQGNTTGQENARVSLPGPSGPRSFHHDHCKFHMYFYIPEEAIFAMVIYLLVHSGGILLFDFWDLSRGNYIKMKWLMEDLRGSRQLVVHYVFYRTCQFMLGLFTAATAVVRLTQSTPNILPIDLMHILCTWSCLWSVLYFVQLETSIGHFIVIVQRMIKDMCRFVTVYFLCFLPFPHVFYKLLTSGEACPEDGVFTSPLLTYYGTWAVMLNMVDFSTQLEQIPDPVALVLLHMVYVFLVGVLLINFLIALFSHSVAEVLTYKDVIIKIQRISVTLCLEDRLGPWLGALYKRRQENSPHFHCEDDKIYIIEPFKNYYNQQPLISLNGEY